MVMNYCTEGKVKFQIDAPKIVSRKMPVFYNPVMELNRELAILLLNSLQKKKMQIADPLAGTGIRAARFLLELPKNKIKILAANDANPKFKQTIKRLIKQNKISSSKIKVHNQDANWFLLNSTGFDYIDIDPFGSPNPYLDSAVKRLSRDGILAVTATDTSALAGSHENACKRKYWARPLRNELMHEVGIRILARKVQLVASQFDKALLPVFCHSTEHYLRIYFQCIKAKKSVDEILKQHQFLLFCHKCRNNFVSTHNSGKCDNCSAEMGFAGPMWAGQLWDEQLVQKMLQSANGEAENLLKIIAEESAIHKVGFYSLPKICSNLKIIVPKKQMLIDKIKKEGYLASQTHFAGDAIKTNIQIKKLIAILKP